MVLSVVVGCQFFEIVWNVEKFEDIIYNRIIRLLPIKLENIKNFLFNDIGDFAGLEIEDNNGEVKTIYKDNLFYFVHNQIFNDIRGNSEIRTILPLIKIKKSLLTNAEKTIARGVGVPIAFADTSLISGENFERYKTLMRNIANTNGAYAIVDKNEIEKIEFLRVDHSNVLPLLEFLNRDIFFNTLTQFVTTGLGQNGARATAEELKSPYALKVSSLVKEFEGFFQWLVNIIISNSSLSLYIKKENYPIFKFVNVSEIDLQNFSNIISSFVNIGLKLNENDLNYIRQLLKLPALENKETALNRQLRQNKINDFGTFERDRMINLYQTIEQEFEKFYDKLVKEITAYIFLKQVIDVNSVAEKMLKYLQENVINIKKEASNIAIKEIEKIKKKDRNFRANYKLSQEDAVLNFIIKIINNVKDIDFKNIEDFDKIEETIKEKTKREKRDLIILLEQEVQNARGEIFEQVEDVRFRYTSMLDKNVCQVCSNLHDIVFTKEELKDAGLNLTSPVNPSCLGLLGGNTCRCQLIPV
ncbi:MAG: hypothetical protein GYA14_13860 [Ignavibacteria bacterium]|nr:hypothetical protein [Ignavibacteria bacterium]